MTGRFTGWRRGLCTSAAGVAVAAGMALGTVGITHADPSTEPSPAPSSQVQSSPGGPNTAPSTVATAAPKPTIALEGGAAAGASTAATTTAAAAAAGDVLDQLADEYATGAGGGQLSNLLKVSLKLRAMGYKPSKQYLDELTAAMKYRPNQLPLIDALKDTIAYQQKIKAQMDVLAGAQSKGGTGAAMGAGAAPGPGAPVSVVATPPAGAPVMAPMPPTP